MKKLKMLGAMLGVLGAGEAAAEPSTAPVARENPATPGTPQGGDGVVAISGVNLDTPVALRGGIYTPQPAAATNREPEMLAVPAPQRAGDGDVDVENMASRPILIEGVRGGIVRGGRMAGVEAKFPFGAKQKD